MMVIADTGPLLALAKVHALDLLKNLYNKLSSAQPFTPRRL